MTVEENIFLAKRNIVDNIYNSAKLEGINTTFPQIEAIINGARSVDLRSDEIEKILALKHAWEFVFETIDYPEDFRYFKELHSICAPDVIPTYRGKVRDFDVGMGGTTWKPDLPFEPDIKTEFERMNEEISDPTDRALTLMLWCMRSQIFADGNKRVSMLYANKILISNGAGVITIKPDQIEVFSEKLINYYETDEMDDIKQWVSDNAISIIKKKELER